ncbi:MAG: ribosome maturation factor RimP [Candidatus Omnitrophota bacterium]
MNEAEFSGDLEKIILSILKEEDIELVEFRFIRGRNNSLLRLLIDKRGGGINLDDCARLNRKIGNVLDENNIMENKYLLEVSSPGLDRPLKTKNDFLRCLNKETMIFLKEAIVGRWDLEGVVSRVEEDLVVIDIEGGDSKNPVNGQAGKSLQIPLSNIAKAKQMIKV